MTDNLRAAVFSVDLSNGDRTVISNSTTGAGEFIETVGGIVLNSTGTVAYVVNSSFLFPPKLFAVNLALGDRFNCFAINNKN